MTTFIWILIATFLVSLISFVGVLILFLKDKLLNKIILVLVAFSAGGLMASALFDLMPEAIEKGQEEGVSLIAIFLYFVIGFCAFFILEQFIKWHHHHSTRHPEIAPFSYLILISDGLHNFIDGLIIAGSFLASFQIGVIATLAVAMHEIPQGIGNFGILIYGGVKRLRALFLNFLSAIAAVLGGIIGFFLFKNIAEAIPFLLAFAAGSFIYISASDLIPEIKQESNSKNSAVHFLVFILGLTLIWLLTALLA
ncbi:MAG: ZIP family metal transporter [Patescibacteria group bacterium]